MNYKFHLVARNRHGIPPFVALQTTGTEVGEFGNFEGLLHGGFICSCSTDGADPNVAGNDHDARYTGQIMVCDDCNPAQYKIIIILQEVRPHDSLNVFRHS